MHRSQLIKERFIQCLENGEISMGDELEIIEHMVNRLNPKTQAEYAKFNNISQPAAKKRLDNGKEATIKLNGIRFVI